MDSLDNRSPAEIEQDLERTRRQISRTIDAIQSRLTPGQVFQEFYDLARGGPTDYVRNLGLAAKNNPVPLALVGIGLTWLATSGGRTPSYLRGAHEAEYEAQRGPGALRGAAATGRGYARSAAAYGSAVAESVADAGGEVREKAGGYASSAAESATAFAKGTSESVRQMAEDARNLAAEWREGAAAAGRHSRERARQMSYAAQEKTAQLWHDQPLVVGAIGVAVGALLGALLPSTEQEDAVMGEARDRLVEQAKAAGSGALQEATDTAKDIAEDAIQSADRRIAPEVGATDAAIPENEGMAHAADPSVSDGRRTP
jgi:hypothetical protein